MEDMNLMSGDGLIILILFFLMFGGGLGMGKNNYATAEQVYDATNQQTINGKLADIQAAITSSAYENSALINNSTNNVINALNSGFTGINANITALGTQLQQCCCDLKSQMLQDKYDAVNEKLRLAELASANAVQTQNLIAALKTTSGTGTT